jgi:hypothetical protein
MKMEVLIRKQVGNRSVIQKTTKGNWEKNKVYMTAEGWELVPVENLIPVAPLRLEPVTEEIEQVSTKKNKKYTPKTIMLEGVEQEQEKSGESDL